MIKFILKWCFKIETLVQNESKFRKNHNQTLKGLRNIQNSWSNEREREREGGRKWNQNVFADPEMSSPQHRIRRVIFFFYPFAVSVYGDFNAEGIKPEAKSALFVVDTQLVEE